MQKIIDTLWIGNAPAIDWHEEALTIAVGIVLVQRVDGYKAYMGAAVATDPASDAQRIAERGDFIGERATRALFNLPDEAKVPL